LGVSQIHCVADPNKIPAGKIFYDLILIGSLSVYIHIYIYIYIYIYVD